MDVTRTAFGMWSGGRFMHFGQPVEEARYFELMRLAHAQGIRTFMTADVYGQGEADLLCGRGLQGIPRESYCLVGTVGHDFYEGERQGAKGFPRFTDPSLRAAGDYKPYLRMAIEKSLERCQASKFDLLLLHNPDAIGYSSDQVWGALRDLRDEGLMDRLGVAPGPANGFTLDLLLCFERFAEVLDWAMIILNPMEPWPGHFCLPAAEQHDISIITRVVDYGGIFHDDVRPGHRFGPQDHRTFRPEGWVEAGNEKLEQMRPYAEKYGLTMLQLACAWNLSHPPVRSVVPTLIEEVEGKALEEKVRELAALPDVQLSDEDLDALRQIGDNTGCMALKGASPEHSGEPLPDRWPLAEDHREAGRRWQVDPDRDLVLRH